MEDVQDLPPFTNVQPLSSASSRVGRGGGGSSGQGEGEGEGGGDSQGRHEMAHLQRSLNTLNRDMAEFRQTVNLEMTEVKNALSLEMTFVRQTLKTLPQALAFTLQQQMKEQSETPSSQEPMRHPTIYRDVERNNEEDNNHR